MSPVTLGPPGLEVAHLVNGFTINDLGYDNRIRLTKITGLYSLADVEDETAGTVGQAGEWALPRDRRGRTVVYEGIIQATTLAALRLMARGLRGACRERSSEIAVLFGDDPTWFFTGRVMQLDMDDEQTTGPNHVRPWQRAFTLGLRLSDPRVYVWTGKTASAAANTAATATNDGNTDTEPTFTMTTVSGSDVTIQSLTLGKKLVLLDLPAGSLEVNFKQRTMQVGSTDVSGKLDVEESDWWDAGVPGLAPGANSVKASRAWTVAWHDADE